MKPLILRGLGHASTHAACARLLGLTTSMRGGMLLDPTAHYTVLSIVAQVCAFVRVCVHGCLRACAYASARVRVWCIMCVRVWCIVSWTCCVICALQPLLRNPRSSTLPPPHLTHAYQIPLLVSELALLEQRATLACRGRARWGGTVRATQPPSQPPSPQPLAALESAETEAEAEVMSAQAGRQVEGDHVPTDDVPRSHVARDDVPRSHVPTDHVPRSHVASSIRPQPTRTQLSNDDAARAQVAQEAKQLAAACTQRGFTSLSQPLLKVADGSCSWCVVRLSLYCASTCRLVCLQLSVSSVRARVCMCVCVTVYLSGVYGGGGSSWLPCRVIIERCPRLRFWLEMPYRGARAHRCLFVQTYLCKSTR